MTSARHVAATAVDKALEATVALSFSRIGSDVRRRVEHWSEPDAGELAGRTVAVTGATSGLGLAAAERLAELGASVIVIGRDPERTAAALSRVQAARDATGAQGEVRTLLADLGSLRQVGEAAAELRDTTAGLHAFVSNAGALVHERRDTEDGIEWTLQTHVVAPFRFVTDLLPLLEATPDSRVVTVTSGGMYAERLDLDALADPPEPFDGVKAYARAKRAQVVLTREWAWRVGNPSRIAFAAVHPGWADTAGLQEALPGFARVVGPLLRTPADGADTMVWLTHSPAIHAHPGALWHDRRPRWADKVPWTHVDDATAQALWEQVRTWAGVAPEQLLPTA